jgi:hypothetical protein
MSSGSGTESKHCKERLDICRIGAEKDLKVLYEEYASIAGRIGRIEAVEAIIRKMDTQNGDFCLDRG